EDLVAWDAGLADRGADALLVAVAGGGVDVAVAGLEGGEGRGVGLVVAHLEHAEPDLRDRVAVVHRDQLRVGHVCEVLLLARCPPFNPLRQVLVPGCPNCAAAIGLTCRDGRAMSEQVIASRTATARVVEAELAMEPAAVMALRGRENTVDAV